MHGHSCDGAAAFLAPPLEAHVRDAVVEPGARGAGDLTLEREQ